MFETTLQADTFTILGNHGVELLNGKVCIIDRLSRRAIMIENDTIINPAALLEGPLHRTESKATDKHSEESCVLPLGSLYG
jgi:hypothetical protein